MCTSVTAVRKQPVILAVQNKWREEVHLEFFFCIGMLHCFAFDAVRCNQQWNHNSNRYSGDKKSKKKKKLIAHILRQPDPKTNTIWTNETEPKKYILPNKIWWNECNARAHRLQLDWHEENRKKIVSSNMSVKERSKRKKRIKLEIVSRNIGRNQQTHTQNFRWPGACIRAMQEIHLFLPVSGATNSSPS